MWRSDETHDTSTNVLFSNRCEITANANALNAVNCRSAAVCPAGDEPPVDDDETALQPWQNKGCNRRQMQPRSYNAARKRHRDPTLCWP